MTLPYPSTPVSPLVPSCDGDTGTNSRRDPSSPTENAGQPACPAGAGPSVVRGTTGGPVLVVHVLGQPAPQGSKHGRPIYRGRGETREFTGKVAQVESSKRLPSWREAVKHAALAAIAAREGTGDPFAILGGSLYVHTVYTFTRPKSHYRTGRYAHLLRDDAPAWPATHGNDIEKLDRGSRDALADAAVYVNDGVVVRHQSWKVYPGSHPDALPTAGAVIRIYRMEDQ